MNMMKDPTIDHGKSESVIYTITEQIAKAEGVPAHELEPPLSEAVDTDALDRLIRNTGIAGRMEGRVVFSYKEYEVAVSGEGEVLVGVSQPAG